MTEAAQQPDQQEATPPPDVPSELLTFRCGGQSFAVDIMTVREIRSWSDPTPLPHSPDFLLGMVNLRGTVLPIMDLSLRLGRGKTPDDPRNVIIVIQKGDTDHGILVEAVSDIVHPRAESMQPVPKLDGDRNGFAKALFIEDGDLIQILSLQRLLPTQDVTDAVVA